MQTSPPAAARGRPARITDERVIEAGIGLGLPNISIAAMAEALGVTQMALYKRASSVEAIKRMVAEAIFMRWQIPPMRSAEEEGVEVYLLRFVDSLCALIKLHPGLPPYLLRRSRASEVMLEKIAASQRQLAQLHGLSGEQARKLMATIAFYCIAGADTVYEVVSADDGACAQAGRGGDAGEMLTEFRQGMRALVIGTLKLLESNPD